MNRDIKDETGNKYGKLTVISFHHSKNKAYWLCSCECGNKTIVSGDKLRRGYTKSCGCLKNSGNSRRTHGKTNDRIYYEWCNMKSRCLNPKNIMYSNYGGRGITLCDSWKTFQNFYSWALSSGYTDELTLERIDVNKGYSPENCSWIPRSRQYFNRTDNHFITAFGKTQTIKEWADETGLKYDTIHARIKYYGWSAEKALTTKARGGGASGC